MILFDKGGVLASVSLAAMLVGLAVLWVITASSGGGILSTALSKGEFEDEALEEGALEEGVSGHVVFRERMCFSKN